MINLEQDIVELVLSCSQSPEKYAKMAYKWGEGELVNSMGLRDWQKQIMRNIESHLSNPATRFTPLRIAVSSGHGVGKSACISIICSWALSTCQDTKIVLTANTATQLASKTMPEVNKWFRGAINSHWFKPTAESVSVVDAKHVRTWRLDAITWSENNTEAFAGLHNEGKRIVVIYDEASAIADKVWEVTEGAMTDTNTEIIWLAFGNPTQNTGRFRECFGKFKHRWKTYQIDSRTVEGTNKEEFQQWVDDYGEDSDFVRVRVKGEFPRAGTMQFISSEIVENARTREPFATLLDPLVMGVDVARFGSDASVITLRRGRDARTVPAVKLRGVDTMTLAAKIIELSEKHKPDAIFVDGGGVGGGVIDRLRMLRQPVIEVQFGASASDTGDTSSGAVVYANKRAEMWGRMRDWLEGGMIEDDPSLAEQLCAVQYGYVFRNGKDAILLEKKEDMKKRGLASPDEADSLACTFFQTVLPSNHSFPNSNSSTHKSSFDFRTTVKSQHRR